MAKTHWVEYITEEGKQAGLPATHLTFKGAKRIKKIARKSYPEYQKINLIRMYVKASFSGWGVEIVLKRG